LFISLSAIQNQFFFLADRTEPFETLTPQHKFQMVRVSTSVSTSMVSVSTASAQRQHSVSTQENTSLKGFGLRGWGSVKKKLILDC
tara:strand:- start:324 stop:581 length:258 start_codon:yes stop_codon:yes gene_type:complete